jgi:hypothetical protein
MVRKRHKVFYGNISLLRVYCDACGQEALVVNGEKKCCGEPIDDFSFNKIKKEGDPYAGPRGSFRPKKKVQEEILTRQDHMCAYCDLPFGGNVQDHKRKKLVRLKVCWDHYIPWAYSQSHRVDFVASCQICNGIKYSKVYNSMEEAKQEIQLARLRRYEP